MSKKIKTKNQYDNAKFLGYDLRHSHNWKRFRQKPKRGKKIGKVIEDNTGGFLQCSICDEIVFLNKKNIDKYKSLLRAGAKPNEIKVTNKPQ